MQDRQNGPTPDIFRPKETLQPFTAKTVLVTGGSNGIGAETCREFARQGAARIVFVSRPQNEDRARGIEAELVSLGTEVLWIGADFSQKEAPAAVIQELKKHEIGKIDVLVNNAAVAGENSKFTDEEKAAMMRANYLAPVALTIGLKDMLAKNSSVINVASVAGIWEDKIQPTYSKSKKLLINMTKAWARSKWFDESIRFNTIVPGFVENTGITSWVPLSAKEIFRQETPGEMATTRSIARKICEMASPFFKENGAVLVEDGGLGEKSPDVFKRAAGLALRALATQRKESRVTSQG